MVWEIFIGSYWIIHTCRQDNSNREKMITSWRTLSYIIYPTRGSQPTHLYSHKKSLLKVIHKFHGNKQRCNAPFRNSNFYYSASQILFMNYFILLLCILKGLHCSIGIKWNQCVRMDMTTDTASLKEYHE